MTTYIKQVEDELGKQLILALDDCLYELKVLFPILNGQEWSSFKVRDLQAIELSYLRSRWK